MQELFRDLTQLKVLISLRWDLNSMLQRSDLDVPSRGIMALKGVNTCTKEYHSHPSTQCRRRTASI